MDVGYVDARGPSESSDVPGFYSRAADPGAFGVKKPYRFILQCACTTYYCTWNRHQAILFACGMIAAVCDRLAIPGIASLAELETHTEEYDLMLRLQTQLQRTQLHPAPIFFYYFEGIGVALAAVKYRPTGLPRMRGEAL